MIEALVVSQLVLTGCVVYLWRRCMRAEKALRRLDVENGDLRAALRAPYRTAAATTVAAMAFTRGANS